MIIRPTSLKIADKIVYLRVIIMKHINTSRRVSLKNKKFKIISDRAIRPQIIDIIREFLFIIEPYILITKKKMLSRFFRKG